MVVTGADGFMGSHLCEWLIRAGAEVIAWVRPTSTTGTVGFALRNLAAAEPQLAEVVAEDIGGAEAIEALCDLEPACVFHLAAEAYVERSFRQPRAVLRTNLDGTMHVLTAARRCPTIERVVVTSSSEVYGPAQTEKIREDHPLEPTSPYAASKVAADRMAIAYHRTYDLPIAIIRPFNTYGPRHVYDVIPKFIDRALRGDPLVVFGDGSQSRDFTFVDDMVAGFVAVAEHPAAVGRATNFGSGNAISISALAQAVVDAAGSASPIERAAPRIAEVTRLCCDAGWAHTHLGWAPKVSLAEGLARNIEWARQRG